MQTIKINAENFEDFFRKESFSLNGCVAALGFFDGVHLAHRFLMQKAKDTAKSLGIPFVVFTFAGDDGKIKASSKRLFTDKEKLILLESLGADYTLLADFSSISELSKEEFINDFLVKKLNTHTGICGFNFRFGKNAEGTAEDFKALLEERGRRAEIIEEFSLDGSVLSSTAIRKALSERKIREAATMLGIPYFITGEVSHGLGLGKKLGIPTVNTPIQSGKFNLPSGVYSTALIIHEKAYHGLTNIGSCPTFGDRETHAETFILNFDGDLYDEEIRIYFIDFLRSERKFSSAEELIMQINVDKKEALELSREVEWQEIGLSFQ